MKLKEQLLAYKPVCEQEQHDKEELLRWLDSGLDIYSRDCTAAHLTASGWVVSPDRKQVLMVYHNLYNSWSWMGGHADGDFDLFAVAQREIMEESGLKEVRPISREIFSVEVLSVDGHIKKGQYVSTHLHLNVTYLFEADPEASLAIKPDENSGVAWFPVEEVPLKTSEPWFRDWIYSKLIEKVDYSYSKVSM